MKKIFKMLCLKTKQTYLIEIPATQKKPKYCTECGGKNCVILEEIKIL